MKSSLKSAIILTLALVSTTAFAAVPRSSISTDVLYGGSTAQPTAEPYLAPGPHGIDRSQIDASLLYGGATAQVTPSPYIAPGPHAVDRGQIDTDLLYQSTS